MDKKTYQSSLMLSFDVDNDLYQKLGAAAKAGFEVIEINSSDPSVLSGLLGDFPNLQIGASGIIDTEQLERCYQLGINFISSPGLLPELVQTANIYSMNYFPGVATLSEAMQAYKLGCRNVKIYPSNLQLCQLINKHIPYLSLFPNEVEWSACEQFLNIPAVSAVSLHNPDITQLTSLMEIA